MSSEVAALRGELVQVAAVVVAIIEDIDYGAADVRRYEGWHDAHAEHAILREVFEERRAQDAKWGPQHHGVGWWFGILAEELGEAATDAAGIDLGDPVQDPVAWRWLLEGLWGLGRQAQHQLRSNSRQIAAADLGYESNPEG